MEFVIILCLILLNGLLAMSEMAIVSARKSKLELDAKKGSITAQQALDLAEKPDTFLSTIQIGITLIGIITGLFSGSAFAEDFAVIIREVPFLAPYALGIADVTIVIVVTYLTLVLGELFPKRIALLKAESISKGIAKPMSIFSKICYPAVWLLSVSTKGLVKLFHLDHEEEEKVTEEEVKAVLHESLDDGEIEEVEHDIVERVFTLGDRNISSLMVYRTDMVYIPKHATLNEIRNIVKSEPFNVYPIIQDDADDVIGMVSMKDLFANLDTKGFSLLSVMKEPLFLPEDMSVYTALEKFKAARTSTALVIDEFGGVVGLITLKDILEGLVGSLPEDSELNEWVVREDGSILVDGQYSFYDFLANFDKEVLYPDNSYNTLGGLILALLGDVPTVGQKAEWNEFQFEVVDMDGARIDKVLVTRLPQKK